MNSSTSWRRLARDYGRSCRWGRWATATRPTPATSAFAGNPLLISLERLAEHGWIDPGEIRDLPEANGPVVYEAVFPRKMPLLAQAARNFSKRMQGDARARFERFCHVNREWLDDFVLFDALRAHHKLTNWNEWPRELAHREPASLDRIRREMADELVWRSALQFAFAEQWRALRHHCARRMVRVVGDIAIFVNYDSADVWTHPELFRLDSERKPEVVSGVPPDFFSETGQRWGNPLYRWDVMKRQGYAWWVARLRAATEHCDYIRLDHFRGFEQFWEIDASEPTAVNGRWVDGPRDDLFAKVQGALGGSARSSPRHRAAWPVPGVFLEHRARGFEGRAHRGDRGRGVGRVGDGPGDELLQHLRAGEQDLALVGEVPEERPLREPRPLGDLRHRGLLEPALAVELQRRLLEPAARVRLPSAHASIIVDDSD